MVKSSKQIEMVASLVARISPLLQGRNGYLPSIGRKGRFLQVKCKKNGWKESKGQTRNGMAGNPSANTVRVSFSNLQTTIRNKIPTKTC